MVMQGTLWATVDNELLNTMSMKKAVFFAFWILLAILIGLMSIEIQEAIKVSPPIINRMPPLPPDTPPIQPPPPQPVRSQPNAEKTRPNNAETVPIAIDLIPAMADPSSPNTASIPIDIAPPQQAQGAGTEIVPVAPAVPRSLGDLSNRNTCAAAILAGYPREARRAGQTGLVLLLITVAADGAVLKANVKDANPRRIFDRAAVSAMMSGACQFNASGQQSTFEVPIEYKLGDAIEIER